jgi:glycosyltransferase involved in cell wall biosynthesis
MKILYFARLTTPFIPQTVLTQPLGGSESALLYLTRALARRGHDITIVNTCLPDAAGVFDGVRYVSYTTPGDAVALSRRVNPDVLVAFRDFPALRWPFTGHLKVYWGHDDLSSVWAASAPWGALGRLALRRVAGPIIERRADHVFVVSEWLASLLHTVLRYPRDRIHVLRNGVHLAYFDGPPPPRHRHRLIYTSIPWRGLDLLLDIFPHIRHEIQTAELWIYCDLYRGIVTGSDRRYTRAVLRRCSQPGVRLVGSHPHPILARDLAQAGLWVYPHRPRPRMGFFAETSCIAAMEAMAAGTPVIASRRGALPELIDSGTNGLLIDGDPSSAAHKTAFVTETLRLLRDEQDWERLSSNARKTARRDLSWEQRAEEWESTLETLTRARTRPH